MNQNELVLHAYPRELTGKLNRKIRAAGRVPAVLYGPKQKDSLNLEVALGEFEKIYRKAGENTIINLEIVGGKATKVLIHDVANHFMRTQPIHVDFYEADLTKKIQAHVPLHFVGLAPAVKELGAILVTNKNEVEVEAMPLDLPHSIEVSLDSLAGFEDLVRVGELKISDKVKILENPEDVVVSLQEPRSEEELAELAQTPVSEEEAVKAVAGEEPKAEGEAGEEKKEEAKPEKKE